VRELRRLVRELDALPSLGVDSAAIDLAIEMSNVFGKMADYTDQNSKVTLNDILTISSHTLSGLFGKGDPFAFSNKLLAEHAAIGEELKAALAKHKRTRAVLTERYEIEFPELR
jgi:hypothetical protein